MASAGLCCRINKLEAAVFCVFICPLSALVYMLCYHMLLVLHPNEREPVHSALCTLTVYGFIQFLLGYIAGHFVAQHLCCRNPRDRDESSLEEIPLLKQGDQDNPFNRHPSVADSVETFAA